MLEFINMSFEEKRDIYRVVSNKLGINEAIIEKDYWVVLILYILFTQSKFKNSFTFKGGTSLSKAYSIIERFSEDIDLVLDWRILGYEINEPWKDRSKTEQRKFNDEANKRTAEWIKEQLVPDLEKVIKELNIKKLSLNISNIDSQTIQIFYPNDFNDFSILQEIRLEIGSLAVWTPVKNKEISAYIVNEFANLFNERVIKIPTVEAKRTFWEKATILHKEAHREKTQTPSRYSRHYYDMYQFALSDIKKQALNDLKLLNQVVDFKIKFYADNSAKYEDVICKKIKLLPNDYQIDNLREDYELMKNMMFGKYPSMDTILETLKELEKDINGFE